MGALRRLVLLARHRVSRLSLQQRVAIVAGVFSALAALLIVVVFVAWSNGRTGGTSPAEWGAASDEVRTFQGDLVLLQNAQNGYLAGSTYYAGDIAARKTALAADGQRLQSTVAETTPASADVDLDALVENALRAVDFWQQRVDPLVAQRAAGVDTASARPAEFGQAFAAVQALTRAIDDERLAAQDEAQAVRDRLVVTQLLVILLLLPLVPAVLLLVRRWVLYPLDHLSGQLRQAGAGDLESPIELPGPPELSAVAASAEGMRRQIKDELERALSAQEALQQAQPLVVEVRDQLAAHEMPVIPGWSAAAVLRPAEGLLAGDWYDVLPVAGGRFAVVLADVSGHGARAGIVAIQLKRLLEAALHLSPDPDLALAMAGRLFGDEQERFASCVVVVVDPDSGVITYANAGHPAPVVVRRDPDRDLDVRVVSTLDPTGPLLSWLTLDMPAPWETRTLSMAPGSVLFSYTDGLTEARPVGSSEELGMDGVLHALGRLDELSPEAIVAESLEEARRFSGGRVRDDITLVAVARDGGRRATPLTRTGDDVDAPVLPLA
ncbi:PP2C family protein-serine/threonine phosphatase [Kineococcus gynurae]|uniref:PP2C family protein-serine/threonine phosphatase n=1 Tax=Kineococcus gynurae TaxID=452979 RepID=A0ABV5LWR8_9ACTN